MRPFANAIMPLTDLSKSSLLYLPRRSLKIASAISRPVESCRNSGFSRKAFRASTQYIAPKEEVTLPTLAPIFAYSAGFQNEPFSGALSRLRSVRPDRTISPFALTSTITRSGGRQRKNLKLAANLDTFARSVTSSIFIGSAMRSHKFCTKDVGIRNSAAKRFASFSSSPWRNSDKPSFGVFGSGLQTNGPACHGIRMCPSSCASVKLRRVSGRFLRMTTFGRLPPPRAIKTASASNGMSSSSICANCRRTSSISNGGESLSRASQLAASLSSGDCTYSNPFFLSHVSKTSGSCCDCERAAIK